MLCCCPVRWFWIVFGSDCSRIKYGISHQKNTLRLGASSFDNTVSRETDFDLRTSFLYPSPSTMIKESSDAEDALGGSIYDPAYYSSLFEDAQENGVLYEDKTFGIGGDSPSTSSAQTAQLKSCIGRSFRVVNDHEISIMKTQSF